MIENDSDLLYIIMPPVVERSLSNSFLFFYIKETMHFTACFETHSHHKYYISNKTYCSLIEIPQYYSLYEVIGYETFMEDILACFCNLYWKCFGDSVIWHISQKRALLTGDNSPKGLFF